MKKVLLDTSFILTCIKQKINFFEDLKHMGIKVIIPKQVQGELRGVDKSGVAFKIIDQNEFIEIDLKNKNVDQGIIDYGKKNMDVFIATLDRGIKKKIENSVVIIREKSRLEIR